MRHTPQIAILNGEHEKTSGFRGNLPVKKLFSVKHLEMILWMMFLRFSIERLRFPSQPCFINIINVSRFQVPYCCHLLYIISHVMVSIIRYGHWFTHFCIALLRVAKVKHNHISTTYICTGKQGLGTCCFNSSLTVPTNQIFGLFGFIQPT